MNLRLICIWRSRPDKPGRRTNLELQEFKKKRNKCHLSLSLERERGIPKVIVLPQRKYVLLILLYYYEILEPSNYFSSGKGFYYLCRTFIRNLKYRKKYSESEYFLPVDRYAIYILIFYSTS